MSNRGGIHFLLFVESKKHSHAIMTVNANANVSPVRSNVPFKIVKFHFVHRILK